MASLHFCYSKASVAIASGVYIALETGTVYIWYVYLIFREEASILLGEIKIDVEVATIVQF